MELINGKTGSLKKGTWSPEEDQKLIAYITRYGIWNWSLMPKAAGLLRSGKSCRLRWMNYLRPTIKREQFSIEEIEMIMKLHESLGNKWSKIAEKIHGRTDNDIKNFWNTHIRKRLGLNTKAVSNGEKRCGNDQKKSNKINNKTRTTESAKDTIHVSHEYPIAESFSISKQSNSSREGKGDLESCCITNKLKHSEVEWNNILNNLCPNFEEPDWRLTDHDTIQEMCINDDMNSYWFDLFLEEAHRVENTCNNS